MLERCRMFVHLMQGWMVQPCSHTPALAHTSNFTEVTALFMWVCDCQCQWWAIPSTSEIPCTVAWWAFPWAVNCLLCPWFPGTNGFDLFCWWSLLDFPFDFVMYPAVPVDCRKGVCPVSKYSNLFKSHIIIKKYVKKHTLNLIAFELWAVCRFSGKKKLSSLLDLKKQWWILALKQMHYCLLHM